MFAWWITQDHHTLLQNEIKPGDYDRDFKKKKKKPVSFWERIKKQSEMQDSKILHVFNVAIDIRLNNFVANHEQKQSRNIIRIKTKQQISQGWYIQHVGLQRWDNQIYCPVFFVNYKKKICLT